MSGFRSALRWSRRSRRGRESEEHVGHGLASSAGSRAPRRGAPAWRDRRSLEGVEPGDRDEAERDVRQRLVDTPPMPSSPSCRLRVVVQAGDELTVAAQHRRDEDVHLPSSGCAAASSRPRRPPRVVVSQPRRTRPARSCARWWRPELEHAGWRAPGPRRPRRQHRSPRARGERHPVRARRASTPPPTGWAWARTVAALTNGPVGVIEASRPPWTWDLVTMWRRGAPRGMRTTCTTKETEDRKVASAVRRRRLAGFGRSPRTCAGLGFAISPGLSIDCDSADDRVALGAKSTGRRRRRAVRRPRPRRHPFVAVRRRCPCPADHVARSTSTTGPICHGSHRVRRHPLHPPLDALAAGVPDRRADVGRVAPS